MQSTLSADDLATIRNMTAEEMEAFLADDPFKHVKKLEGEMMQLRWRKQEAATRIKGIMDASRKMYSEDKESQGARDKLAEKAEWVQEVIADELQKPLAVDPEFMERFEKMEAQDREQALKAARNQSKLLNQVREQIEAAHEARMKRAIRRPPSSNSTRSGPGTLQSVGRSTLASSTESLDKLKALERQVKMSKHRSKQPSKARQILDALCKPVLSSSRSRSSLSHR